MNQTKDQTSSPISELVEPPAGLATGTNSSIVGACSAKASGDFPISDESRLASAAEPPSPTATTTTGERAAAPTHRKRNWLDWRILSVLAVAGCSIPVWRATTSHAKAQRPAATPALPVVAVAQVKREDLCNEVPIVAEFRPYFEVDLHAKVSGFVQEINVDIGDRVKAGQLLARLEIPELQDELDQALATQKRAEAEYHAAHLAFTRLLSADKQNPNLFVQQDLDTAEAKDRTTEAAIAAAKAEVEKYQTLLGYTRITAPFDGVITRRFVDPGALIQSGTASATQSLPLLQISDNYRLRLDFPVSICYVKDVKQGDTVDVEVQSLGGKTFTGTISRFTHKIDGDTRTMTTEIEVPNPDLELIPGMYAKALFRVQKRLLALAIPTEAVSSGENGSVFVINNRKEIEERPVTLGLETPTRWEVKAGLKEGELILIGARTEVRPGEKVEPKLGGSFAKTETQGRP